MESAFLRMWDVPRSVIFCRSCILTLPTICCTYFPNPFLISTMTPITTGIVLAFIPHILSPLISRSFSYFIWSVLSSGDGHINEQAACFVFVLDYNVWSLAFLSISVCIYWHLPQDCDVVLLLFRAHAQTISHLCLYSSLCRCSSGGMTMAALLVCVCIQYWPAHDHSAPCHNMVNSFLKLTTNPVH